jgi:uncharacterized protein YndB with AHSA1/START domain
MTTDQPGATTGTAGAETTQADAVVREIYIEASPETVWEFFVDPEKVVLWKGVATEIELRPGGRRWLDMHGDRDIAVGEHTVIDPPRHIGFTWGWEGDDLVPPGSSTVDVFLTEEAGGTRVRLEHRGLPSAEQREKHGGGWEYYLGRLAVAAVGDDPGPDQFA